MTQEKSSVQGWLGRRVRSEGDSWEEFGAEGAQEKSSVQGWLGGRVRSEGDSWKEFGSEGDRREELVARRTQDKSSPEQSSPRYPRAMNARVRPRCESSRGTLARSRGELSEKFYCSPMGLQSLK